MAKITLHVLQMMSGSNLSSTISMNLNTGLQGNSGNGTIILKKTEKSFHARQLRTVLITVWPTVSGKMA